MKIHCLSDTHLQHKAITMPGGDLLIHSGDCTSRGTIPEIIGFLDWLGKQPYTNKVLVPGNHDFGFEEQPVLLKQECVSRGIILLNDSGVTIDGIKIWGSAITPWFHDWAFNRYRGDDIRKHWELIPDDTDILVTHGPPMGILDFIPSQNVSVGCADLLTKIYKTSIKLHIFGHIHEGRGYKYKDGRTFVNASALDGRYSMLKGNPTKVTLVFGDYVVFDPTIDTE